jgi:excinuclease UvrABC helicase subunit UvrB
MKMKLRMLPATPTAACWDRLKLIFSDSEKNSVKVIFFKDRMSAMELFYSLDESHFEHASTFKTIIDGHAYDFNRDEVLSMIDVLGQMMGDYMDYLIQEDAELDSEDFGLE